MDIMLGLAECMRYPQRMGAIRVNYYRLVYIHESLYMIHIIFWEIFHRQIVLYNESVAHRGAIWK